MLPAVFIAIPAVIRAQQRPGRHPVNAVVTTTNVRMPRSASRKSADGPCWAPAPGSANRNAAIRLEVVDIRALRSYRGKLTIVEHRASARAVDGRPTPTRPRHARAGAPAVLPGSPGPSA